MGVVPLTTEEKRLKALRGTDAEWTSANPTLLEGEIGYSTDGNYFKVGDGTTTWSSLTSIFRKDRLYDEETISDISSTNVQIDLSTLFAAEDGFIASYAWSGGDGTAQITFDGGTYTGKTIGGVDADTLAADLAGDGQGRITFRKDGNDLRILTQGVFDSDGGNFSDTFEKTSGGALVQYVTSLGSGQATVVFPVPMVNTSYRTIVSPIDNVTSARTAHVNTSTKTVNGFDAFVRDSSGSSAGDGIDGIAEGRWTAEYLEVG
jgi:hypothetical protein